MELKTIMYCGLTGAKLTIFFLGMLVLSDISVLLHNFYVGPARAETLWHCAYHYAAKSAFRSRWWLPMTD